MNAVALFGYFVLCVLMGIGITVVLGALRPVKRHDDFRAWWWTAFFTLIFVSLPYIRAEWLTQKHGEGMRPAVERVLRAGKIKGHLDHYKVVSVNEARAEVIIVAREQTLINPTEGVIMTANLTKRDGKWRATTFKFIDSFKRNKDGTTFPPYW